MLRNHIGLLCLSLLIYKRRGLPTLDLPIRFESFLDRTEGLKRFRRLSTKHNSRLIGESGMLPAHWMVLAPNQLDDPCLDR